MHGRRPGPRPPWWPEDQPWPPAGRRHRRLRPAGCLLALIVMRVLREQLMRLVLPLGDDDEDEGEPPRPAP